jgi:hypothetical protein
MGDPSEIQKGILQPAWMVKAKRSEAAKGNHRAFFRCI